MWKLTKTLIKKDCSDMVNPPKNFNNWFSLIITSWDIYFRLPSLFPMVAFLEWFCVETAFRYPPVEFLQHGKNILITVLVFSLLVTAPTSVSARAKESSHFKDFSIFAKLSPSSSFSWTELDLIFPHAHSPNHPDS